MRFSSGPSATMAQGGYCVSLPSGGQSRAMGGLLNLTPFRPTASLSQWWRSATTIACGQHDGGGPRNPDGGSRDADSVVQSSVGKWTRLPQTRRRSARDRRGPSPHETEVSYGFVDESFGPARALRAVGTARGQRWRVAHRLSPLACLSSTNSTGPATLCSRRKRRERPSTFTGTDQNAAIHLYTHERACPEARSARGRGVSNNARARQRPWISAVSARADSRAA